MPDAPPVTGDKTTTITPETLLVELQLAGEPLDRKAWAARLNTTSNNGTFARALKTLKTERRVRQDERKRYLT